VARSIAIIGKCVIEREAFGFGSVGGKKIISLTKGKMPGKRGFGVLGGVAKSRTNTMQRERETRLKYFKVYHSVYFTMPFFCLGLHALCKSGKFHFRQQVTVS